MRQHPNIALSGTPGTGKSTLAQKLVKAVAGLTHIDLGVEAEQRGCREAYDEKLKSWIIDEDKLAKAMKQDLKNGGLLLDWIHADFWPARYIDLCITVRASNTLLYDRYQARGYSKQKIDENIDAEILGEVSSENQEYYGEETDTMLMELESNSETEMEENVAEVQKWIEGWHKSLG